MIAICTCLVLAPPSPDPAAGLAKPTPEQLAWHDSEIGMFIHLAPNTWQDQEYDDLSTPPSKINPTGLDTDQWVGAAEAMGAKFIVFVAKHVGGFCWWRTDTTDYSVKSTPWRGGKGDVLADLAESCRRRGMKLGIYLSPCDRYHGAEVGGRCADPEAQERYSRLYRAQLREVLSRYGDIFEVWFDGGNVIEVGDILKACAPHAVIFQGKYASIRWVGNEDGVAPYPAWNCVSEEARLRGSTAADGDPSGNAWLPNECDARIRADWFWNTRNAPTLKSVDQLMDMYCRSVGHGAVLLLNMTPDTTGRMPEADVKRAAEFGAEVRRQFGTPIAETSGTGDVVELSLHLPKRIGSVVTMEDISGGERVREYVIEGLTGSGWRELSRGPAIGHKKIDRIGPVEVVKIRLRVTSSVGEPLIRSLAVHGSP